MTDPNSTLWHPTRSTNEPAPHDERLATLGRLIAQVTHELNGPLTTARLIVETLDLEPIPYASMELVQSLRRELEHAETIVRDLLLFVHPGPAELVELDAAATIRDVLSSFGRRLTAAGVTVQLDLDEPLPTLRADPHGLRRVITNLVQNALHALTEVEGDRRVTIRAYTDAADEARSLVIEVQDSGPGIPANALSRIFEPFFTTKPLGEGTGLGLSIVKEMIARHGGTVEALPAAERGTLFRIRLPVLAAEANEKHSHQGRPAAPPVTSATGAPTPDQGRPTPRLLRILIIDDEPELQRALQRILEHLGCAVTTALDGATGVQYAREQEFDLVLCDVRIPGLSGPELLDELRRQAPRAAESIVFMTGDTVTRGIRDFIRSTGRPSLTKPFGRDQLLKILASVQVGDS